MRSSIVVLACLLGVALLWLSRGSERAPPRSEATAPRDGVAEAEALVPPPPLAEEASARTSPEPGAADAAEPRARWAEDVLRAGGVQGTARLPDGEPASGVTVHFAWNDHGSPRLRSARTERDGSFFLEVEEGARGELLAWDHFPHAPAHLAEVRAGTRGLEVNLGPAAALTLDVVDRDGRSVRPARVRYSWPLAGLEAAGPEGVSEYLDEPVRWPRSPIPFLVEVSSPEHRRTRLGPLDPARIGPVLTVVLDPLPRVRGRVVQAGMPVEGARLALVPEGTGTVPSQAFRNPATGADGAFDLSQPPPGRYELRAYQAPLGEGRLGPIVLDGSADVEGLVVPLTTALGSIEGRVLLPPGHAPDEVCLRFSTTRGFGRLQPDGSFTWADVPAGTCTVSVLDGRRLNAVALQHQHDLEWSEPGDPPAWLAATPQATVEVRPGETARLEIDLANAAACLLAGAVRIDGAPPPLRDTWPKDPGIDAGPAAVLDTSSRSQPQSTADLDARGAFELTAQGPGTYRLRLVLRLGDENERWRVEDSVELAQGTLPWTLSVATAPLSVQCAPGTALASLAVVWQAPGGATVRVRYPEIDRERGQALFRRVPVGRVRVESASNPDGTVELELVAGVRNETRYPR